MANPIAEQIIEDLTLEKVNAGKMFTAFDITLFAKKEKGMTERHNNIKHVVHDLFVSGQMPGYARTLINISGAPTQAFLYHPQGADVSQYNPKDRSTFPNASGSANATANGMTATSTTTPATTPTTSSKKGQTVDRRGRLCVSNKLIRQLAWKGSVFVKVVPGGINLSNAPGGHLTSYWLDKDDNVRISARTLRKCGLATSNPAIDRYNVVLNVNKDGIEITRA